jgi:copper ion binding protein
MARAGCGKSLAWGIGIERFGLNRQGGLVSNDVKQEFAVKGMHCDGCVNSVTRSISRLPGVRKVDVSLERMGATVEYDGAAVQPAAILAAIDAAGFEGSVR